MRCSGVPEMPDNAVHIANRDVLMDPIAVLMQCNMTVSRTDDGEGVTLAFSLELVYCTVLITNVNGET